MKIKVKDYEYTIIEVDDTDGDFYKNGDLKLYGQARFVDQIIKIYKDLSPIRKRQTLIHELTHVFIDVFLSGQAQRNKYNEEDICCFIATYSEDILRIVDKYFNKEV
jgi:hypothetical protein